MIRSFLLAISFAWAGAAAAEAPRVSTDILPVQGLVARVMKGVGAPEVIVTPPASPHGYALRPSDARALSEADVIFWVGKGLTPWLADRIETLADAETVVLMDVPETRHLETRDLVGLGEDGHDDHGLDDGHEEDGHDDYGHDDHGHGADDHGHDHGGDDPHAWLDPANAVVWTRAIAATLSAADPANAALYAANAEAAIEEIRAAEAAVAARLSAPLAPYAVGHDAYIYFETAFGVTPVAAVSNSDAADPGPRRIAALRDAAAGAGVTCILLEPGENPGRVASIFGGDLTVGTIDPLGALAGGEAPSYPRLLEAMAEAIAGCAAG